LQWLKKGDPTEAVRVLNTVLNAAKKYNIHLIHLKQIEKARDEADIGNPATAETFLEMILSDL
jgi:nicotinamidase-related amidase